MFWFLMFNTSLCTVIIPIYGLNTSILQHIFAKPTFSFKLIIFLYFFPHLLCFLSFLYLIKSPSLYITGFLTFRVSFQVLLSQLQLLLKIPCKPHISWGSFVSPPPIPIPRFPFFLWGTAKEAITKKHLFLRNREGQGIHQIWNLFMI